MTDIIWSKAEALTGVFSFNFQVIIEVILNG